jgi:hypothetical protein
VRKVKPGSGCVLSDLAYFFLKLFSTFFPAFSNSQKVRLGLEKGLGLGSLRSLYQIEIQLHATIVII